MTEAYWTLSQESKIPPSRAGLHSNDFRDTTTLSHAPPSHRQRFQEGFANSSYTFGELTENKKI